MAKPFKFIVKKEIPVIHETNYKKIVPSDKYRLLCTLNDNTEKVADITAFIASKAFKPLQNAAVFAQVKTMATMYRG